MHPAEFWELTIGEFYDCMDGYEARLEATAKLQDRLNYLLGQYVGMAVNASDKHPYPREPFLARQDGEAARSGGFADDDALEAYIRSMADKQEEE